MENKGIQPRSCRIGGITDVGEVMGYDSDSKS